MILLTQQINRNDNAKGQQQWNTKKKEPKQNARKNGLSVCVEFWVEAGKQTVSISSVHQTNKLHAHQAVLQFNYNYIS